jgi:hypothetical protein
MNFSTAVPPLKDLQELLYIHLLKNQSRPISNHADRRIKKRLEGASLEILRLGPPMLRVTYSCGTMELYHLDLGHHPALIPAENDEGTSA